MKGFCVIDPAGNPLSGSWGVYKERCWIGALLQVNRQISIETQNEDTNKLIAAGYQLRPAQMDVDESRDESSGSISSSSLAPIVPN